jgi:3-isopropylmalate dehydrogenase
VKSIYNIAVLPGDGIGVEVTQSALNVLHAVQTVCGVRFNLQSYAAGAQHYLDSGDALPTATLNACGAADAILFGAMGLPHVRGEDGTEIIPQLDIRFHFDLYAGVRPIRTFAGLPTPLRHPKAAAIDLVLVRESTEGLFYARGRGDRRGDDEVFDTQRITRVGTERVCTFAFDLARQRKAQGRAGMVTSVDKANVFASMAFWREIFEREAKKPWDFDVLVTENMFGDILSDLVAALVGGMGMAPSADIGDNHAVFQPAHGTAPDIAGKGIANPTAMLLSVVMMLDWLAARHADAALTNAARVLERAIEQPFARGEMLTFDFGGSDGTEAVARKVIAELEATGA